MNTLIVSLMYGASLIFAALCIAGAVAFASAVFTGSVAVVVVCQLLTGASGCLCGIFWQCAEDRVNPEAV